MEYEDISTVISILPVAISETKPGLVPAGYSIPAVSDPSKELNLLHIERARFSVYIDEARPALIVPEPSDRVASAICRDYKVSMSHVVPNVSEPGLFWVKDKKSKTEFELDNGLKSALARARTMQIEWFKRLISEADDHWTKYRMRRLISDMQRKAARLLNLEREWNLEQEVTESLSQCKFCFAIVNPAAVVCSACGGILDIAKAKTMGYAKVG